MFLNLKTALPSDPTTTLFGFKRTERFNYVCGRLMNISTKDADGVLREVRRMVYTLGLHGGFNEIQEEASGLAIREQREVDKMRDPLAEESKINFTERLRRWRSYIALRALSILDKKNRWEFLET